MIIGIRIILAMLVWGSVGIFVRFAEQPAPVIVFFRVLTAWGFLLVMLAGRRKLRPAWDSVRHQLPIVGAAGAVLALNWIFFFQAVTLTTVANAVLAYYMAPVIVTILAPFLLKERLERQTIVAVLIALTGTILMNPIGGLHSKDFWGIASGLAAAVFYALVTMTGKKVKQVEPISLVFWQTLTATFILFPYLLWIGMPKPTVESLTIMGTIGIVHTAFALTLYFAGLNKVKVQHVGVLGYLDPVSAILFAYLFLAEVPGWQTLIGGVLILFANLLILRPRSKSTPEEVVK